MTVTYKSIMLSFTQFLLPLHNFYISFVSSLCFDKASAKYKDIVYQAARVSLVKKYLEHG